MSGDYFIKTPDGRHAGRVMSFVGNPFSRRWVAYSGVTKETPGFPTLKKAADWLVAKVDDAALDAAKKETKR
jgi:hypothetical protein